MDTLFVQKSVSFHHFPWFPSPGPSENDGFWSSGHTFCEKKCVISSFSMIPGSGRVQKPWILTIWTHFLWKKCVILTFPMNLAGVLASQTRIISFIYKTDKVLEKISFRISSFIYELRRVLRRRLYATRNFGIWARGRLGFADSPKPWYSYRIS